MQTQKVFPSLNNLHFCLWFQFKGVPIALDQVLKKRVTVEREWFMGFYYGFSRYHPCSFMFDTIFMPLYFGHYWLYFTLYIMLDSIFFSPNTFVWPYLLQGLIGPVFNYLSTVFHLMVMLLWNMKTKFLQQMVATSREGFTIFPFGFQ